MVLTQYTDSRGSLRHLSYAVKPQNVTPFDRHFFLNLQLRLQELGNVLLVHVEHAFESTLVVCHRLCVPHREVCGEGVDDVSEGSIPSLIRSTQENRSNFVMTRSDAVYRLPIGGGGGATGVGGTNRSKCLLQSHDARCLVREDVTTVSLVGYFGAYQPRREVLSRTKYRSQPTSQTPSRSQPCLARTRRPPASRSTSLAH